MAPHISTAVTYSARCGRSLLRVLRRSRLEGSSPPPNSVLLFSFAPSQTTPPEVLSQITSALTQLCPEHVGCISAPLPSDPRSRCEPHTCTLAYAFVNGVSFRSTIPGHAEAHVGRWHGARERGSEGTRMHGLGDLSESNGAVDWRHVWDRSNAPPVTCSSSTPAYGFDSSTFLHGLPNADSSAIDNILYFSDKSPEGLESVLQSAFPRANKLSLIASSTPFITGRPVTLFHNGSILSNGAVGVAFSSSLLSPPPVVELSFPPLVALSRHLSVTSSKGNLILSLDSKNPTQLLLGAIQERGISSSHTELVGEFYVGVMDPSSQQISQLYRISAGDPSRGSIALDATVAPSEGSVACLYHLHKGPIQGTSAYFRDVIPNSIALLVAPETTTLTASPGNEVLAGDDEPSAVNAFLAASENGFTLSRGAQGPWKCAAPGASIRYSCVT